jgi:hypothetical protein
MKKLITIEWVEAITVMKILKEKVIINKIQAVKLKQGVIQRIINK